MNDVGAKNESEEYTCELKNLSSQGLNKNKNRQKIENKQPIEPVKRSSRLAARYRNTNLESCCSDEGPSYSNVAVNLEASCTSNALTGSTGEEDTEKTKSLQDVIIIDNSENIEDDQTHDIEMLKDNRDELLDEVDHNEEVLQNEFNEKVEEEEMVDEVSSDEKEFTEMKNCEINRSEQQQQQQSLHQQYQNHQQFQQQSAQAAYGQQNQAYGNFTPAYQHTNMGGHLWYPQDQSYASTEASQQALHYPQPHIQGPTPTAAYRQPQYTMDPLVNQAYNCPQNQLSSNYGVPQPSYIPQYVLGSNGQYFRTVQSADPTRYEILDNQNVLMSHGGPGIPPGYRAVPPASMSDGSSNPGTSYHNNSEYARNVNHDKEWVEGDESEEEMEKLNEIKPKKERVKRPMNAFLVWSCQKRAILAKNNPGMNNADISVRLGEKWKAMTPQQKQPFYEEAAKIKADHKLKHPEWTYQPKPKKRRLGQGITWLYAITENTRGGRMSQYVNSFNHFGGSVLPSTNNSNLVNGQNVMTMPVQPTSSTHNMYVSHGINPGVAQRTANLINKPSFEAMQPNNPAMYLQSQTPNGMMIANQQAAQNQHLMNGQMQAQNADQMNSMFQQPAMMNQYQQQDFSNQARSHNLEANRQESLEETYTPQNSDVLQENTNYSSSSCEKYTDSLIENSAEDLVNMEPPSDIEKEVNKKKNDEDSGEKNISLNDFEGAPLSDLPEFLNTEIIQTTESDHKQQEETEADAPLEL